MIFRKIVAFFYDETSGRLDKQKVISIPIVIVGFILIVIFNNRRLAELDKDRRNNARYTIGVTMARYMNRKSQKPTVEYFYYVNGNRYSTTQSYPIDMEITIKGGRYYVEFSSKHPDNAKILLDKPVGGDLTQPPANGWTQIP